MTMKTRWRWLWGVEDEEKRALVFGGGECTQFVGLEDAHSLMRQREVQNSKPALPGML